MPRNTDLFKLSKILLQFQGETESPVSNAIILFRLLNGVVFVFVAIFTFVNFFYAYGDVHVKTAQSLITVIHGLLKFCFFIHFKTDIRKLLKEEFRTFWKDLDRELVRRTNATRKLIAQMQMPLLNRKNPFLLETWTSNNIVLDGILLACQYYFFCVATIVVLGYDTVYLSLCVHVAVQLRILRYNMEKFSLTYNREKRIGRYVECHQLLLSTFGQMKRIYSAMLLFHYFVTLLTVCSDLYEVLLGRNIVSDIIIKFVSICLLFAQFAFYTFPAAKVASEFSRLSNSIYMSKWYRNTINVQKQLLFMMLKCNQQSYFSAAGFINVNIDTFGSVVRKSFSFYAILRNILNK
ncbi:putative odorant receptor [Trypoxylus dichotomus]